MVAVGIGDGHLTVYASFDGGGTWQRVRLPHSPFGNQLGDAVVIVGDQVTVLGEDDAVGTVWTGRLSPARRSG